MSLTTVECITTTYNYAAGYLVDVVDFPLEDELKIYLHHCYYDGIKIHVFDIRKDELGCGGAGELEDIIEGRLVYEDFIQEVKQRYFYISNGV